MQTPAQIRQAHFFLLSVLFFPYSVYLHNTAVYKEFTHSLTFCFVPRFNRLPSVITASGADGCNSFYSIKKSTSTGCCKKGRSFFTAEIIGFQKCIDNCWSYIPPDRGIPEEFHHKSSYLSLFFMISGLYFLSLISTLLRDFFIHPVKISLCIWNFWLNLK